MFIRYFKVVVVVLFVFVIFYVSEGEYYYEYDEKKIEKIQVIVFCFGWIVIELVI